MLLERNSIGQMALIRFHIIAYRSGKKKDKKYRKRLKTLGKLVVHIVDNVDKMKSKI
jgi:hypothetical protein